MTSARPDSDRYGAVPWGEEGRPPVRVSTFTTTVTEHGGMTTTYTRCDRCGQRVPTDRRALSDHPGYCENCP